MRLPEIATPLFTWPRSFVTQRVLPVRLRSAQTRPFQSPTKTDAPTTSGDDSEGPIVRLQSTRPVPTLNAITCPVSAPLGGRLHGGAFMNVSYTTCLSRAGDAARHRCERYFQARFPFLAPIANIVPALLAKKSRP